MADLYTVRFRTKKIIAVNKDGKWTERIEWVDQVYHALPWATVQGYKGMKEENQFSYERYYGEETGKRLTRITVGSEGERRDASRDYSSLGNAAKKPVKRGKGGYKPKPAKLPKAGSGDYSDAINKAMEKVA